MGGKQLNKLFFGLILVVSSLAMALITGSARADTYSYHLYVSSSGETTCQQGVAENISHRISISVDTISGVTAGSVEACTDGDFGSPEALTSTNYTMLSDTIGSVEGEVSISSLGLTELFDPNQSYEIRFWVAEGESSTAEPDPNVAVYTYSGTTANVAPRLVPTLGILGGVILALAILLIVLLVSRHRKWDVIGLSLFCLVASPVWLAAAALHDWRGVDPVWSAGSTYDGSADQVYVDITGSSLFVRVDFKLPASSPPSLAVVSGVLDAVQPERAIVVVSLVGSNVPLGMGQVQPDGNFSIALDQASFDRVFPEVPEGYDNPLRFLQLEARIGNRSLRAITTTDIADWQGMHLSAAAEAFIQLYELSGSYTPNRIANSDIAHGIPATHADLIPAITVIAAHVDSYFSDDQPLPSRSVLFHDALSASGANALIGLASDLELSPSGPVVAGGIARLGAEEITGLEALNPEVSIQRISDYLFRIGQGQETGHEVLHLTRHAPPNDLHNLIPVEIKSPSVELLAEALVTPFEGGVLEAEGVTLSIPPLAVTGPVNIRLSRIRTDGAQMAYGKPILKMEPEGLQFDRPVSVAIPYKDYGLPDDARWMYGSALRGYEPATVLAQNHDLGSVTLALEHFTDVAAGVAVDYTRGIFLMGPQWAVVVPGRDKSLSPSSDNKEFIRSSRSVLTNRLIDGASTSNLQGSGSFGGGQCVQTAYNVILPLMKGQTLKRKYPQYHSLEAQKIINYIRAEKNAGRAVDGLRNDAGDCQFMDVVAISNNTDTGHIGLFSKSSNGALWLINSNDRMYGEKWGGSIYPVDATTKVWHERFGIGKYTLAYGWTGTDKFVCLDPSEFFEEVFDDSINNHRTVWKDTVVGSSDGRNNSYGYNVKNRPWLYYLMDSSDSKYGTTRSGRKFTFVPDLNIVVPLAAEHIEVGDKTQLRSKVASDLNEFRLYVSQQEAESYTHTSEVDLKINPLELMKFGGSLLAATTNPMVPGVDRESDTWSSYEVSTDSSHAPKVLFSPAVIDDAYAFYEDSFRWNCVPMFPLGTVSDDCVRIGFWSGHGYNVTTNSTAKPDVLHGEVIESDKAVNGYYLRIKKHPNANKAARWAFAHTGKNKLFVSLPEGKTLVEDQNADKRQMIHADYTLETVTCEPEPPPPPSLQCQPRQIKLKLDPKLNQTKGDSGALWYALVREDNNDAVFDLTGYDSVHVVTKSTSPAETYIQVDALRVEYVGNANKVNGSLRPEASPGGGQATLVELTLQKKSSDGSGQYIQIGNPVTTPVPASGINFQMQKTAQTRAYRLLVRPLSMPQAERPELRGLESADAGSQSLIPTNQAMEPEYLPEALYFDNEEGDQQLPEIVLRKAGMKDQSAKIIDATTGSPVAGATVELRYGAGRSEGDPLISDATDSQGLVSFGRLPYATYSIIVSKEGYARSIQRIDVGVNTDATVTVPVAPVVTDGDMRVVLSWGPNPADLDSHIMRYSGTQMDYHVYYGNKVAGDAMLDRDVTTGYGPETITVNGLNPSKLYRYVVHHYSGSGDIATSGAVVNAQMGSEGRVFYPPGEQGRYWHVFDVEAGKIMPCTINCISDVMSGPNGVTFIGETDGEGQIVLPAKE